MEPIVITAAVLAGWAIRRKSAEVLKIRRANQAKRSRRYRAAMSEKSWRQIMAIK